MKITQKEFEMLEAEWYAKLAEQGFKDIEKDLRGERVLINYSYAPQHPVHKDWQLKKDYFETLEQKLNDPTTIIKKDSDRIILEKHNEGMPYTKIRDFLEEMGICKHRNTIRNIIWRYQWKWKLRIQPPTYYKHNQKIKQHIPS